MTIRSRLFEFSNAHKKPGTRPGSSLQTDVLLSGYSFTANWTIDQLNVRHRRVVTSAETALEDAQVATLTGSVTLAQVVEELTNDSFRTSTVESQTAVSQAIYFGQSDQRLSNATQFFGFWQSRFDQLVLEQRHRHVLKHGLAVRAGAAQVTTTFTMTHGSFLTKHYVR